MNYIVRLGLPIEVEDKGEKCKSLGGGSREQE